MDAIALTVDPVALHDLVPPASLEEARIFRDDLNRLLRRERLAAADFLVALADFDRRRGWERLGHASLFGFLTRELRLSSGAAQLRLSAARLLPRHPAVEEAPARRPALHLGGGAARPGAHAGERGRGTAPLPRPVGPRGAGGGRGHPAGPRAAAPGGGHACSDGLRGAGRTWAVAGSAGCISASRGGAAGWRGPSGSRFTSYV